MFVFFRKGRRKEKDSPTPIADEYKQYLEEDFIRDRITDADLETLVELPPDLDSNEWLATHSKYHRQICPYFLSLYISILIVLR